MAQRFLYVYVFFTGAAVMAIEMAASRLLAPYFGTSLMVWANIIGIILLAMAAGYYWGGRLADRRPKPDILYLVTMGAGLILTAIPALAQVIFKFLTAGILATPIKTIVLAFAGTLSVFAPPIFLLAMVSPFALRLSQPAADQSGKIAGRLYACSTLGSLLGTFVPSFLLIPYVGTRATIYLAAFVLLTLAAWGLKRWWPFILALLPLLLLFFSPRAVKAGPSILWEKETPYQYVQVMRLPDQSTALVYNEGGGIQSVARPGHQLAKQDYYDYYLILPYLRPQRQPKLWILGSAGGTMLGLFDHWVKPAFPGLSQTGVEIDPDVIPLGRQYFGLTGDEQVVNADARTFLSSRRDKSDLIIVDAYTQQIYIPFHLATQEFYRLVQDHLNPGGILAININALSASSRLLQAFEQTVQSVFPYTYVLPVPDSLNFVLVASDQPVQPGPVPANLPSALSPFWQHYQEALTPVQASGSLVLTDDQAPVEFLTDQMIWQTILGATAGSAPDSGQPILGFPGKQSQQNGNSKADQRPNVAADPAGGAGTARQPAPPETRPTDQVSAAPLVKPEAMALFEQGHALYMQRKYEQAVQLFDQALAVDPQCYPALNDKGAAYAFLGRYDAGLALIQQSLQIYPSYQHGYFNKGLALELAGRWEQSIAAYTQALALDDQDVWAYYGIASIYGRHGKVDKVIEYLQRAIALDPEVREIARDEHDFAPVAQNPRFRELVGP